jgi:hypothetical protein
VDGDCQAIEERSAILPTPHETLEWLAQHMHYTQSRVRMGVAGNPSAPPHLLARLAQDDDAWVRYYVAENPNTPEEWKSKLVNDPLPDEYQRFLED